VLADAQGPAEEAGPPFIAPGRTGRGAVLVVHAGQVHLPARMTELQDVLAVVLVDAAADRLSVYYGGADSYTSVATMSFHDVMDILTRQ
jgi:predicted GH43/DUF377 family glycosyl hydrolase